MNSLLCKQAPLKFQKWWGSPHKYFKGSHLLGKVFYTFTISHLKTLSFNPFQFLIKTCFQKKI